MSFDRRPRVKRGIRRPLAGALVGISVLGGILAGSVQADPADDALAKLNELSREAEQTTEAMHSAQLDLNVKVAAQQQADAQHAADMSAVDASRSTLATFQTAVNKVAAAQYMGGRTDGMNAMLTADSPQQLIDEKPVVRREIRDLGAGRDSDRQHPPR